MPWSEPRGGGDGIGGLGNGVPFVVANRVVPPDSGLTTANDWGPALYVPADDRIVVTMDFSTPRVFGAADVYDRMVEFTSIAAGAASPRLFPNWVDGGGFLLTGSPSVIYKTTNTDPATAVFTDITDPTFASIYTFSLTNGSIYSRRSLNGLLNISTDGGATWALSANVIAPGGNDDIDNCFVSRDGSIVAIGSPDGISFMDSPENGSAGELGSVLSGSAFQGSWNANNNIFCWLNTTAAARGEVRFTTDFNTVQTVPVAGNPFQFDGASGLEIRAVTYVPALEGWVILGDNSAQIVGFLPESDMSEIIQGAYIQSEIFSSSVEGQDIADGQGNFALYAQNIMVLRPVFYG